MKSHFKSQRPLLGLIVITGIAISFAFISGNKSPVKTSTTAFRDLNKNGRLDIYEDPSKPVDDRVNDLLSQMNLEEKAGMMFISGTKVNDDGSLDDQPATGMFAFLRQADKIMDEKKMTHF